MDFRTNQYKEALKSETRHTAAATAKAYKEMQAAMEAELAAGGSPARSAPPPRTNRFSSTSCSTKRSDQPRCQTP